MKKRVLAMLLVVCMVVGMMPAVNAAAAAGEMPFTDVKSSDWFYDEVQYVYEKGMMNGVSDNKFAPNAATNRAMLVTILYRLEGEPAASGTGFTDVAKGQWYYNAVLWASANGIVSGYGDGKFGPTDSITREQMAVILYRYAMHKGYESDTKGDIKSFEDYNKVSSYAVDALNWAVGSGLIGGVGNNKLDPKGTATRAQVATILMRFCEGVVEKEHTVTFNYNYGGKDSCMIVNVSHGNTVKEPDAPNRIMYLFMGWYCDKNCNVTYKFSTPITEDITLYAGWLYVGLSGGADDEKSEAEEYYETNSELLDVIDAGASRDVPTEAEVLSILEERGFTDYPVTYEFSIDGTCVDENEAMEGSDEKHPTYQTYYLSENEEMWVIYIVNGAIMANPVSFDLVSDLGAPLMVCSSNSITSYDNESNNFYVRIPFNTELVLESVYLIDSNVLDGLTISKLCELTGATPPEETVGEEDEAIDTLSLNNTFDGFADSGNEKYGIQDSTLDAGAYSISQMSATEESDPVIVVSMGDSYASGEGVEPFYGQEKDLKDKVNDLDWLAHRSKNSWGAMLEIPGVEGKTGDYWVGNGKSDVLQWYFVAASGATTEDFNNEQVKEYWKYYYDTSGAGRPRLTKLTGKVNLPSQLSVFEDENLYGKVDYVTISIGGNDVKFAKIIEKVILGSAEVAIFFGAKSGLEKMLEEIWFDFYVEDSDDQYTPGTTAYNIKQAYRHVADAAGPQAEIIVVGYPLLLAPSGAAVDIYEADMVNEAVTEFNKHLKNIVSILSDEMNIHYVSVQEKFENHQAYAENIYGESLAWINPVWFAIRDEDINDEDIKSSYSMHPNLDGQRTYADCVNETIRQIEANKKTGTLSGKICMASDRTTPVPNATIVLRNDVLNRTYKLSSDANGNYSRAVPAGSYYVTVTADGFIKFTAYATVEQDQTVYLETFLMVQGEETDIGTAVGCITNALSGMGISGVNIDVRSGWNNADSGEVLTTITTNASGNYSVTLPIGNYTLCASKEGYIPTMINIVVQNGETAKNGSMTPIISGDSFRIVLTWGASPRDLDSHVEGTLTSGEHFHVYYSHKSHYDGDVEVCNLDVDDVSSYGPETITLNVTTADPYYYYIYNYSGGSTSLIASEAQINVYQGSVLVATFNVPTDQANARYWNVFALVDGEMIVKNTITSSADLSYADTQ